MANAILAGTYVRSTFVEHQRGFVEHFQYGKQIGQILDIKNRQKTSPGPKTHFIGLESENSGNHVPIQKGMKIY